MKRKKTVRKPRKLFFEDHNRMSSAQIEKGNSKTCTLVVRREYLGIPTAILYPKEARRLAKWLLQFADWSDSRKGEKG